MTAAQGRWIPLGSAQIIDWRQLDLEPSVRGSTAWVTEVGGGPVLVRTWSQETTTHFEFTHLARAAASGRIVVALTRSEPGLLSVEIRASVADAVDLIERAEFREHPRTALQAPGRRSVEDARGRVDADGLPPLSAEHAEILEYAPESALHAGCGGWLGAYLGALVDAAEGAAPPRVEGSTRRDIPAAPPEDFAASGREPTGGLAVPPPEAPPRVPPVEPRPTPPVEPPRAPPELRSPDPTPRPPPERPGTPPAPPASSGPRLRVATNAGESWELDDAETYIGRSKQCTVVLKSQRVSRKHASVTREPEGWFINDLGAANGIWAGTEKIERERIEPGSEFIIGDVLLSFDFV